MSSLGATSSWHQYSCLLPDALAGVLVAVAIVAKYEEAIVQSM